MGHWEALHRYYPVVCILYFKESSVGELKYNSKDYLHDAFLMVQVSWRSCRGRPVKPRRQRWLRERRFNGLTGH